MGIAVNEKDRIFGLHTTNTSYLIGVTEDGYVGHIYYGKRVHGEFGAQLLRTDEVQTPAVRKREKSAFLDYFPTEFPSGGIGDYRESCIEIRNEKGQLGAEFLYESYEISKGKPSLSGLPASFAGEDESVATLTLNLKDHVLGVSVKLLYSIFEKEDIITRSVIVENTSESDRRLEKIFSACLDMDNEDFEMITLTGSWARERNIGRRKIEIGRQSVGSTRGESSHQQHPFLALVTPGTDEEKGDVYGMHFVYSGNFLAQAEVTQWDSVRMTMGIHPHDFAWKLEPGEVFTAPECVLVYSDQGLGKMSRSLHDFYRNHLIRSRYLHEERPILINNWEATYFDFNTEKLLSIAKEAKAAGIEMLVMDDGWFGHRNADNSSLGDWTVNESKITGGLKNLVSKVHEIGLKFGIWFEPEMISPDSELFRKHPEWALQLDRREPTQSREQYVLDLSRPEVLEYAYESVARILRDAPIDYVKWDMNRQLCDMGSSYLPVERQGELFHRYTLGVYQLQERLITEFPNLLLENCSGGGARFDPGMLYYSPQIWCSDDMDPVERLRIQEGTELIYPLSTMGAHVCCAPNHTTGRSVSIDTRADVALAGTFGYELDITQISEEERARIPSQVAKYHRFHMLIAEGDYYRIRSWNDKEPYDMWGVVSKDKSEAIFTWVQVLALANRRAKRVRLKGLDAKKYYQVTKIKGDTELEMPVMTGEELMQCGLAIERVQGDCISWMYHLKEQ